MVAVLLRPSPRAALLLHSRCTCGALLLCSTLLDRPLCSLLLLARPPGSLLCVRAPSRATQLDVDMLERALISSFPSYANRFASARKFLSMLPDARADDAVPENADAERSVVLPTLLMISTEEHPEVSSLHPQPKCKPCVHRCHTYAVCIGS